MAEVKRGSSYVPVLDCGGLLKDYDLHKVTTLSAEFAGMDALSLNIRDGGS